MNAERAVDASPGKRTALVFALLGICLFGVWLGGWMRPVVGVPGGTGPLVPSGLVSFVLPVAAGTLLLVATLLFRRTGDRSGDATLHDPQTGLYCPGYANEAVANLAARDDRNGRSQLTLVLIRIDYLDDIKNRYGRAAVDELRRFTGRQIRGQSREGDLPTHDGDGFAVYLQCEEQEQARAFCRRLAMLVGREQFELRGDVLKVSISMGMAVRERGESLETVRQRAEVDLVRR